MKRMHRVVLFVLVVMFTLTGTTASFATEDTSEAEVTETTVATEEFADGEGPALIAPPLDDAPVEQPWTVRFLYPTIAILTILLIVGVVIGYNHSVRNRYRVVG